MINTHSVAFENTIKVLTILTLIMTNPIILGGFPSVYGLFPDSATYLAFSQHLWDSGELYLKGWGHIDRGTILPIFYPFLIGLFTYLTGLDSLLLAQYISHFALLLTSLFIFYWLHKMTHFAVAAMAVFTIQFSGQYIFYGGIILTEGLFILVITASLLLTYVALKRQKKIDWFFIGLLTVLLFFTRQIGIFYIVCIALLLLTKFFLTDEKKHILKLGFIYLFGIVVLLAPYLITVYAQTGHSILKQHFRLGHYTVTADNAHDTAALLSDKKSDTYVEIWEDRRVQGWKLVANGNEMFGFLVKKETHSEFSIKEKITTFFQNIIKNIGFIFSSIGGLLFLLYILAIISSVFFSLREKSIERLIFLYFTLAYVLVLSLITGAIERYIDVLAIFIIVYVFTEFYFFINFLVKKVIWQWIIISFASILILFSLPKTVRDYTFYPHVHSSLYELSQLRDKIKPNDAIFSMLPVDAYLAGGVYRIFPNGSFNEVFHYAKKTNVKWLLLSYKEENYSTLNTYPSDSWLHTRGQFVKQYPDKVRLVWLSKDSRTALFELNIDL